MADRLTAEPAGVPGFGAGRPVPGSGRAASGPALRPRPLGLALCRMIWTAGWMLIVLAFTFPPLEVAVSSLVDEHQYDPARLIVRPGFTLSILAILMLLALLTGLTFRLLTRIPLQLERVRHLHAHQGGALIVEFALAFPFILVLVFILFQWTELLIAESLTHYAAFAAARVGVTWGHMPDAGTQGSQRFQLDSAKKERMRLAAEAALAGGKLLEVSGDRSHQQVELALLTDEQLQEEGPQEGGGGEAGGAYRSIAVNVTWGFFPRWPLSQIFFNLRSMLQGKGRIQMTRGYRMQAEGYFQSNSLRDEGQQYQDREEIAQCALYEKTLEEGHKQDPAVSGTRQELSDSCPSTAGQGNPRGQVQCN